MAPETAQKRERHIQGHVWMQLQYSLTVNGTDTITRYSAGEITLSFPSIFRDASRSKDIRALSLMSPIPTLLRMGNMQRARMVKKSRIGRREPHDITITSSLLLHMVHIADRH